MDETHDDTIMRVEDLAVHFPMGGGLLGGQRRWLHAVDGVDLELKRFDGFSSGTIYACTSPAAAFLNQIIFRPDGRVVRTGAISTNDGIYIVDTLGDATASNDKIRGVQFGLSGRTTVLKLNGQALPCVAN